MINPDNMTEEPKLSCLGCDPPGCNPYDDFLKPMIELPVSYSQLTFIDIHSQAEYHHLDAFGNVVPDLDQTALRAKNFYSDVWAFMQYRTRTENYVVFGETNPVENAACDTFTSAQANAMLFGYAGQNGYKNSGLFANRAANVVMRPWHRTEGLFACTPSPNIINLPFNPNP